MEVTFVAKAKHAILWRAVKAAGGTASALASRLGVHPSDLGKWLAFITYPPFLSSSRKHHARCKARWTPERIEAFERCLFDLTAATLDDIWPTEVREALDAQKNPKAITLEQTKEIPFAGLLENRAAQSLLSSPEQVAMDKERREIITKALGSLSYREREIIKHRFGLAGPAMTQDDLGRVFKITKSRIAQIESKAIRKLGANLSMRSILTEGFDEPDAKTVDAVLADANRGAGGADDV